jgi:hypothetical protein
MAIPLDPPIFGTWTEEDFPQAVEIDGMTFVRAIRRQPYKGVVAQYRQDVARDSLHLMVLEDRNWLIDHADSYNPDLGHPVRHFLFDHPSATPVILCGSGLVAMGIAIRRGMTDAKEGGPIVRKSPT